MGTSRQSRQRDEKYNEERDSDKESNDKINSKTKTFEAPSVYVREKETGVDGKYDIGREFRESELLLPAAKVLDSIQYGRNIVIGRIGILL